MADIIQIRRGTTAQWTAINPVLAIGEFGFEIDANKYKIGDGVTAWLSLAYTITTYDHGTLTGLVPDDDHTQYHTDGRANTWHGTLSGAHVTNGNSHDHAGGDGAQISHGGLSGLSSDDHSQYHNDTRGDARYFQKTEHLAVSAGAGDAGKPIKLDAGGKIDASMLDDGDVDHASLSNLAFATSGHTGFQRQTYFSASDPTANEDSVGTAGHGVFLQGYCWYNYSTFVMWICTDATATAATWEAIGMPKEIYIKATSQAEGNVNFSDGTNWNTNKAILKEISIKTSSTDWSMVLYPDSDFDELGLFPSTTLVKNLSGEHIVNLDIPYVDMNSAQQVHIKLTDNGGSATFDVYIRGERAS